MAMRTLSIIKMVMLCVIFGSAGINADIIKGKAQVAKIEELVKIEADTIKDVDKRQKMQDIQMFLKRYLSAIKVHLRYSNYTKAREIFTSLYNEIQTWPKNNKRNDLKMLGINTKFLVGDIYHHLALCYTEGWGGERNYKTAFDLYRRAILDEDYIGSINNWAGMYYNGLGIEQNIKKAGRLFLLEAQQGNSLAQFNLGQILFKERIFEEAYYWYILAKKQADDLKARSINNPIDTIDAHMSEMKNPKRLKQNKINELQSLTDIWKLKQPGVSSGSGFYITKEYILTNAHVVCSNYPDDPCKPYDKVRTPYYRLSVEKIDIDVDLALLKFISSRIDSSSAKIRLGSDLQLGEGIAVFGYPLANKLSFEGNFTIGNVSAREGRPTRINPSDFFQFTAPVQSGNSGGPVLDAAGNVVGVVVENYRDFRDFDLRKENRDIFNVAQNINFAVSLKAIKNFLKDAGVETDSSSLSNPKKWTEVAKAAEEFTVPILCFKNK